MSSSPYNDYWKELRKLCAQELLSAKQIQSIQPIKDEEVKKVIDSIAESASLKNPVNLSKKFLALTTSVVLSAAFGVSFEETVLNSDRFNKLVGETFKMLGSFPASDFIPYVGWIIDQFKGLQGLREKSVRDLDAFYEQMFDLKMVIKETWRLHPPTPLLLPREVMTEFEINGYTIPVKTRLYVNVWAIGRDPDTWKDPEMFLPERFMDNNIDAKGQNFELLSFGSGRRICPGMYMGTTMVECGLANMLYHFDWKLPEGMAVEDIDMEEAPGLTMSKKNDLLLVPVKHLDH